MADMKIFILILFSIRGGFETIPFNTLEECERVRKQVYPGHYVDGENRWPGVYGICIEKSP